MSEEIEGQEPEAVEAPQIDPEAVDEARKYGWKPKEEFTLAPEGWVDAERFLELPSTQNKRLRDINREQERRAKEMEDRLARSERMATEAVRRAREQERKRFDEEVGRIEREKRAAAESADLERYDQLSASQGKLKPPSVDAPPEADMSKPHPDVVRYAETAPWMKDQEAVRFAAGLVGNSPEAMMLPPVRQMKWAEERVKQYFPEHFEAPPRPQPSRVDGGGLAGGRQSRSKGYDDLPPDAKTAAKEFVDSGLFKSVGEYAEKYWSDQ